jgi:hypothetical protein
MQDSKDHRGWIIGHFLDQADGVRASDEVEVKVGHPPRRRGPP